MSADNQSLLTNTLSAIEVSADLSDAERQTIDNLLTLLRANDLDSSNDVDLNQSAINLKRFVDGRGLACPMPLLKTKVALRDVASGESLYIVATDANSQADIAAFCRQSQQTNAANPLSLIVNTVTSQQPADVMPAQRFDTIYHFIITKTDSN